MSLEEINRLWRDSTTEFCPVRGSFHHIVISLPTPLRVPITGGCDYAYCKAHPDRAPAWDTISTAPGFSVAIVHYPKFANQ